MQARDTATVEVDAATDASIGAEGDAVPRDALPADTGGLDRGEPAPDTGGSGRGCETMGQAGVGYFDPEFLSQPLVATFQDATRTVWLARIDPVTGLFMSGDGRERLVAESTPSLLATANGPELGVDRAGAAVFFSKESRGALQVWRAPIGPGSGALAAAPLTAARTARFSPIPSQDPSAATTKAIFLRGRYADADVGYLDEEDPAAEGSPGAVTLGVSGPRWIRGTSDFVFATTDGTIARYATASRTITPLTSSGGFLTDAFVAPAPEAGGLVMLAIEDQSAIAVFAERGGSFVRTGTIDAPDPGFPWLYSAEPVVVGDRTYVTFHAQADRVTPPGRTSSSVWISPLPIGRGPVTPTRVDDGSPAHRIDPETVVGRDELFVYFNVLPGGGPWEVVRCRTGISGGR